MKLNILAKRHVIKRKTVDSFSPYMEITRGQFATMITRALGLEASSSSQFTDTKGKWY